MTITNPFITPEFIRVWLKKAKVENSAFSYLSKRESSLFPFLIRRNSFGLQICEPCAHDFVDYFDLSDLKEENFQSLLQNQKHSQWDILILHNIASLPSTETSTELQSLINKGKITVKKFFVDISPFLKIEQSWDEFYTSTRSSKSRYNLRRAARKLDEMGGLEIVHCVTPDEVEQNIDIAFEIYEQHWEDRYTSSKFSQPEWQDFYKDIAVAFAEKGWMDLVFLKVNKEPIAFCYGFIFNNKYYFYITAFKPDPAYRKYSPGKVLLKHLLEESFRKGLDEFDFMLGDEAYKKRWTEDYREVYTYVIGRNIIKSKLAFQLYTKSFSFKQGIRNSKIFRPVAEKVLSLFGK